MKLLLILLSVMTLTIKDKRSVTADGTWPYDFEVSYYNTGNKGSVTAKDTATLTLSHLDGIAIEKVEVYVRSNKDAGSGMFTVTANGEVVTTKSGTYKEWFGAYNNTDFQALSLLEKPIGSVDALVIQLTGLVNSIHIEKYVITWGAQTPKTVTFMQSYRVYTTLTEESANKGVRLPQLPDTAHWHFVGWTLTQVWEVTEQPEVYLANAIFHPKEDCTLWALYGSFPETAPTCMTEIESGAYMYVNRDLNIVLADVPDGGTMAYAPLDASNDQLYYYVDFVSPDTAYIAHAFSLTPIGYVGNELTVGASPWLVYHEGEETLFYMIYENKPYILWLNIWHSHEYFYAGLLQAEPGPSPMALMTAPMSCGQPTYTCHPDTEDVEQVSAPSRTYSVPFGPFELIINNGKKELRIR